MNSILQGVARFRSRTFRHADDAKFFAKGKGTYGDKRSSLDHLATHIWRNDLENIPFFILVLLGYVLIVDNKDMTILLGTIFCLARTLHTIFFIFSMQPWRNLAYQAGVIVTIFTIVKTLIHLA